MRNSCEKSYAIKLFKKISTKRDESYTYDIMYMCGYYNTTSIHWKITTTHEKKQSFYKCDEIRKRFIYNEKKNQL